MHVGTFALLARLAGRSTVEIRDRGVKYAVHVEPPVYFLQQLLVVTDLLLELIRLLLKFLLFFIPGGLILSRHWRRCRTRQFLRGQYSYPSVCRLLPCHDFLYRPGYRSTRLFNLRLHFAGLFVFLNGIFLRYRFWRLLLLLPRVLDKRLLSAVRPRVFGRLLGLRARGWNYLHLNNVERLSPRLPKLLRDPLELTLHLEGVGTLFLLVLRYLRDLLLQSLRETAHQVRDLFRLLVCIVARFGLIR